MDELFSYIKGDNYQDDVCFGINFEHTNGDDKWTYSLLYNITGSDDYLQNDVPSNYFEEQIIFKYEYSCAYYDPWITSGFIVL